jgi:ribosomal protein S18 acetylase RimI-like enzyme
MDMEIVIERATLDDIDGLIHVYKSDGIEHKRELDSYPLTEWILEAKNNFIVAKSARKPIGFILARKKGDEVKIDLFSVTKKYKGKGAERKLLEAAEGLENVMKITSYTPKSDKNMVNLFKKEGFLVYNEIKDLFGEGENGLYLIKAVGEKKHDKRTKETKSVRAARSFLEENIGKLDIYLKP